MTVTKDRRLYARFDIGMDEHAKIMLLSDAAFRALFESTLYSRRQLTDGFLDERIVTRKWGLDVASELSSNDPERPSWVKVDGGWMIHDFAEHQVTSADIQAKREAGRKGGLAKASKPLAPASKTLEQTASTSLAKTETETETYKKTSSSPATPPMEFDTFWAQYPRKVGKQAAIKAYAKSLKLTTPERILEGVKLLKSETAGKEIDFIPHPSSWLNAGRWDDEPSSKQSKPPAFSPWSQEFHK